MKKLFIFSFIICATISVHSQGYICLAKKAGAKEWGYINEKGDWAVPPRPGKCFEFSSGLAVVLPLGSKQYGFIDSNGQPLSTSVGAFKLKEIFGFGVKGYNYGMVAVKVGDRWGFLNTEGKLVIPPKYEDVSEWYEGNAAAMTGEKWFVLNADGSETPVSASGVKDVKHFSEGLAPFYTLDKKAGFVDTKGQVAIQPKFQSVGYFYGGLAWAKLPEGKVGYINKTGDWVIQPQFEAAKEFDPVARMARVKSGEKWGYVSDTGQMLNIELASYGDFVEGLCYGKVGAQVGFFDNKGAWVIQPKFEAVRDFRNGYAAAKSGENWGIIDRSGNWVIQPTFDGIRDMEKLK
jgi:hypothetical protein